MPSDHQSQLLSSSRPWLESDGPGRPSESETPLSSSWAGGFPAGNPPGDTITVAYPSPSLCKLLLELRVRLRLTHSGKKASQFGSPSLSPARVAARIVRAARAVCQCTTRRLSPSWYRSDRGPGAVAGTRRNLVSVKPTTVNVAIVDSGRTFRIVR